MTRNQLIENTFSLNEMSASLLLLLRVVFDVDKKHSSLDKDIYDLFEYPERLQESYRDEWCSWIKNTLHRHAFRDENKPDCQNLSHYLEQQYLHRSDEIKTRYCDYIAVVEKVTAMQNATNVQPFKSKLKRNLEILMQD
jgi:hypothetical protein